MAATLFLSTACSGNLAPPELLRVTRIGSSLSIAFPTLAHLSHDGFEVDEIPTGTNLIFVYSRHSPAQALGRRIFSAVLDAPVIVAEKKRSCLGRSGYRQRDGDKGIGRVG